MYDLKLESVNLKSEREKSEIYKFLNGFGLILDKDVDYTVVLRNTNGSIKATCSKSRNILKCFAISEDLRGENITSSLISYLIDKLFEEGIYHSFLFTKPDKINIFTALNFKLLYEVEEAALLEYGIYDINKFLDKMIGKYKINTENPKGALVMNCNPFTEGHRYLIEEAARSCKEVLVFIVEEDKSAFPFKYRYSIVKEGVKDLKNVIVIPGSEYIISSATFPSYFIRKEDDRMRAYQNIDCGIFGNYFCSRLNIVKRFVGKEPYCNVTNCYNETLKNALPKYDIDVIELERKMHNEEYISASKVRQLIRDNELNKVRDMVPRVTWDFLNSKEGEKIIHRIGNNNSPH